MTEKQPLLDSRNARNEDSEQIAGHQWPGDQASPKHHRSWPFATPPPKITGDSWMSHIPSSTLMSALTIPGTHDSAAYTYSWPFIATQTLSITAQLDAGIRFFDLRCGLVGNELEMVHGSALLNLRLSTVLSEMYAWLSTHPSEALIAQIKRDRKPESSTLPFSTAITNLLSATPSRWRTANTTPTLGELRSRIQLFRRFTLPSPRPLAYGIDVTPWPDNPSVPFTISTPHATLTIQDHYSFPSPLPLPSLITQKGLLVSRTLALAASPAAPPEHWFVNFTSAFEFNLYYQIPPREIAAGAYWGFRWEEGVNARLGAWLDGRREELEGGAGVRGRLGVVVMDFPEKGDGGLVGKVLGANFGGRKAVGYGRVWVGFVGFVVVLVLVLVWMFGRGTGGFLRVAYE